MNDLDRRIKSSKPTSELISKRINVPTGDIVIMNGERGMALELLSIGDYGKSKNVKADFLGLSEPIDGVPHGAMLPLEEKWVITISSQYGCSMGCTFCDVPIVGPGLNASIQDLLDQVAIGVSLHPEVLNTERLNVHYARMGEPTWNRSVIDATKILTSDFSELGWGFHPVVSTMMPRRNTALSMFLKQWLWHKADVGGNAGLQVSVNTTDDAIRERDFGGCAMRLEDVANMFVSMFCQGTPMSGRKIALNFALTGARIDASRLAQLFSPELFMCKLTPMHKTAGAVESGAWHGEGYRSFYPYKETEEALKASGFDVIVFVPSLEEDESRITCGNAILADAQRAECMREP